LQLSLLGYGQYFLAGFLLTEFYLSTPAKRGRSRIWDIVAVAGWTILLASLVRRAQPVAWLAPAIIFLLCVAAFQGVAVRRFVTNPWIATIGGMCYSIYLLHNYAIAALGLVTERLTPAGPFTLRLLIQFVISSPIVLAICALYFRLIERPCMRPDWYRYRRKTSPNDL
jgi:peptidoglycan/LPS O-acetylase OafA/YrhL